MKRLLLLTFAALALAAGVGEIAVGDAIVESAQACGGTVTCCDSEPSVNALVDLVSVENAAACGGAAGLAWHVVGQGQNFWAGPCSSYGASAWVGGYYWYCTWFYG